MPNLPWKGATQLLLKSNFLFLILLEWLEKINLAFDKIGDQMGKIGN